MSAVRVVLLGDSHLARVRRDLPLLGPNVHNAAVGGACVHDLEAQVAVASVGPGDVAVVSVGTNDAAPWKQVTLDDFAHALQSCLRSLPARRAVYVAPPGVDEARLGGPRDRTNRVVDDYRAAAVSLCGELGIHVVHAERVIASLGAGAFVDDGLHLTGRAYRLLLPAVAAAIR